VKNMAKGFALYIESLRKSRKISREDFVENIMSIRQYQRHLKGETSISNDKIFLLVDKLEMDFFDIYNSYVRKDETEYKNIYNIYSQIVNLDYKKAHQLIIKTDKNSIHSNYNKSFYNYCKITVQNKLRLISDSMAINKLKANIDYPECLDIKILNSVELITLISISGHLLEKDKDDRIANFLYDILINRKLLVGRELDNTMPSIFATTCKLLGILGEHKKVLEISQEGIEFCFKNQILNSLVHLLYYKSLALLNLVRKDEAIQTAKRAFMLLEVEGHSEKMQNFECLLEKHFNMKVIEL